MKTKTVNRTGKSLVKKALVVGTKKNKAVDKGNLKEINEKIKQEKVAMTKGFDEVKENVKKDLVKADKKYDLTIDAKDMLMAGCHLGHKVSKTNPKVKDYLYAVKEGIQIFDLTKSFQN